MPWTDKPKRVDSSEEKMARIAEHIRAFSGRKYYPDTDQGFEKLCEAVADIVYDKPNGSLWDNKEIPFNPLLGHVDNDLDWLMKRAFSQMTTCPMPAHFRSLYCDYFIPADRVQISIKLEDL